MIQWGQFGKAEENFEDAGASFHKLPSASVIEASMHLLIGIIKHQVCGFIRELHHCFKTN